MTKDFLAFLKEFNIISLASAFIMGAASTTLVGSLVKDIIMPILAPLLSSDSWREATLNLGPVHITYGSFLAELVNFVILAFVVFLIAKKILKLEKVN
jgi:large conductance mechanosensitive channel